MTISHIRISCSFFAPILVAMAVFMAVPAETAPFAFVDEGASDPVFTAFRKPFAAAIAARDLDALKQLSHPRVRVSLSSAHGWWALSRTLSRNPALWRTLSRVVNGGGRFTMEGDQRGRQRRVFIALYTFFAKIPGRDAAAIIVLKGENVPVRAASTNRAHVLARLTDEALEVVFGERTDNLRWFEVRLNDGQRGFVKNGPAIALRDGWRAGFTRHHGRWKLRYFLGGD